MPSVFCDSNTNSLEQAPVTVVRAGLGKATREAKMPPSGGGPVTTTQLPAWQTVPAQHTVGSLPHPGPNTQQLPSDPHTPLQQLALVVHASLLFPHPASSGTAS